MGTGLEQPGRPKQQWEIEEENNFPFQAGIELGHLENGLEDLEKFLIEETDKDRVIQNVARFIEEAKERVKKIDGYLVKISQKNLIPPETTDQP